MIPWWEARSARERRLLAVMVALLAIVLLWLAVVRPLADALDDAKRRHGAAVIALAEAQAARPAAVPAATGPVDSIVAETAAAAGFTGIRVARLGPARAGAAVDAARPQALFGWIAEMERRGLVVERLRTRANADRTVSAEIALKAGGR
jgi:general secretion pathway protein M